jgi:hypothetical protein
VGEFKLVGPSCVFLNHALCSRGSDGHNSSSAAFKLINDEAELLPTLLRSY